MRDFLKSLKRAHKKELDPVWVEARKVIAERLHEEIAPRIEREHRRTKK